MSGNNSIDEMKKKYKEEMMKLYSKASAKYGNVRKAEGILPENADEDIPRQKEDKISPEKNFPAHIEAGEKSASKFPPPDEILFEEAEAIKDEEAAVNDISGESAEKENMQGNYGFDPAEENPAEKTLEPLYSGERGEKTEKLTGKGFLKAEVTTGGGAIPVEGATVIITKKEGDGAKLVKMLISGENGETETVTLPAPDLSYSETPDPSERPFAEYTISAAADGFYMVPEMTVPVFSTIVSIQPVSMIPLAEFDEQGSAAPDSLSQDERR